eukprot:g20635.t1
MNWADPPKWRYILEQFFLFPLAGSTTFRNQMLDLTTEKWLSFFTDYMVFSPAQAAQFPGDTVEDLQKVVTTVICKLLDHHFTTRVGLGTTLDEMLTVMDAKLGWVAPTVQFARKLLVALLSMMIAQVDRFKHSVDRFKHSVSDLCWGNLFDVCGVLEEFMFQKPALIRKGASSTGKLQAGMHLDSKGCQDAQAVEKIIELLDRIKAYDMEGTVYEQGAAKQAGIVRDRILKERAYWNAIHVLFQTVRMFEDMEGAKPSLKAITEAWKELKRTPKAKVIAKKTLKEALTAMVEFMFIHRASEHDKAHRPATVNGKIAGAALPGPAGGATPAGENGNPDNLSDSGRASTGFLGEIGRRISLSNLSRSSSGKNLVGAGPPTPSRSVRQLVSVYEQGTPEKEKGKAKEKEKEEEKAEPGPKAEEAEPVREPNEDGMICPFGTPVAIPKSLGSGKKKNH